MRHYKSELIKYKKIYILTNCNPYRFKNKKTIKVQ